MNDAARERAEPSLIAIPEARESRGNLAFIEGNAQVPFAIGRVYYLYDIPGGTSRGSHAHRTLQQLIIPIAGSFDVHLDSGHSKTSFHLNRANIGLAIPPMHWRTIDNFASGSVCLVIASAPYEESDYIRDWDAFLLATREEAGR